MADYKLPEEFIYEGTVWGPPANPGMLELAKTLDLRSSDVVIATYPKSGTTWMKYILFLMHNGLEYDTKEDIFLTVPYLEMARPDLSPEQFREKIESLPPNESRCFASHTDTHHLHKHIENGVKFIAVMRNPKDTLVSFYHFYRMGASFGYYDRSFSDWFELVKAKRLFTGDIFDYNHQWWNLRERDNVLIVFYEDMKREPHKIIEQVAQFCGKSLSEETVEAIVKRSSFNQMKENPLVNASAGASMGFFDFTKSKFIRKGEVGDWKNYFTQEESEYIDKRCKEEWEPVGLKCDYGE